MDPGGFGGGAFGGAKAGGAPDPLTFLKRPIVCMRVCTLVSLWIIWHTTYMPTRRPLRRRPISCDYCRAMMQASRNFYVLVFQNNFKKNRKIVARQLAVIDDSFVRFWNSTVSCCLGKAAILKWLSVVITHGLPLGHFGNPCQSLLVSHRIIWYMYMVRPLRRPISCDYSREIQQEIL